MPGRFFKPQPMLPPVLGTGVKQYVEYVSSYEIYLQSLEGLRALWKTKVKKQRSYVKDAATRGCQVRIGYDVKKVKEEKVLRNVAGVTVMNIPVTRVEEKVTEFPLPDPPKQIAKTAEQQRDSRKAKRRRHRQNVRARKAKHEAKVSSLEAKASKNKLAMLKAEYVSSAMVASGPVDKGKVSSAVTQLIAGRVRRAPRSVRKKVAKAARLQASHQKKSQPSGGGKK